MNFSYELTNDNEAISYMQPEQTSSKKYKFAYSQCEPIYCRCLMPIQDSPGAKLKYTGNLQVEQPYTALLSAILTNEKQEDNLNITEFDSMVDMSPYLISFVVGKITHVKINDMIKI